MLPDVLVDGPPVLPDEGAEIADPCKLPWVPPPLSPIQNKNPSTIRVQVPPNKFAGLVSFILKYILPNRIN